MRRFYEFDGQQLSLKDIQQRVPMLSETCLKNYLKAGITSKADLLVAVTKSEAKIKHRPHGRPFIIRTKP